MYRRYKRGTPDSMSGLEDDSTNKKSQPPSLGAAASPTPILPDPPMHHGNKSGGLVKAYIKENTIDELPGVDTIVFDAWRIIEQQCRTMSEPDAEGHDDSTTWKTIRIFVSSTFTDYHSEREMLVKKVFPALREWCEERKLSLVECDLRWGVPKDTDTKGTIESCMEELDRCHEETKGEPFFLNMLSERYGWIPTMDELPEDLKEKYDWVPNVSITAMEIIHGAYRSKNKNALFFIRKPDYLRDIPEKHLVRFVDDYSLAKAHLLALKKKLVERFSAGQVHEYSASVEGIDVSTGREKVVLKGLEKFADITLEFFKEAIFQKYPRHQTVSKQMTSEDESELQSFMKEVKIQNFVGRENELETLLEYAKGTTIDLPILQDAKNQDTQQAFDKLLERYALSSDLSPLLCVTSESGVGKSSVLAKLADIAEKNGLKVIYHSIGISEDSVKMTSLMRTISTALVDDVEVKLGNFPDIEKMLKVIKEAFSECAKKDTQCLFIFDGIDEMFNKEHMEHLLWLPPRFPSKVRCVVSANMDHFKTMSRLQDRRPLHLELSRIDIHTRKSMANNFFERYNKRLDPEQLTALISLDAASVPLWLSIACEELRLFGDFRTLTTKIKTLPDSLSGLIEQVISRLVKEDDTGSMEKLLCLLYCSPNGLAEGEMRGLLGDPGTQEEAPLVTWVTLRRYVKPFIHSIVNFYDGSLRIHLFHRAMKEAVREKFITDETVEKKWHVYLADFYQHRCNNIYDCRENLPYHLEKADEGKRLIEFYRKDKRSLYTTHYRRVQSLFKWRCKLMAAPTNQGDAASMWMCSLCAMKPYIVFPTGTLTGQCCSLCGQVIMNRSPDTEAKLCIRHLKHTPVPGGGHTCVYCNIRFREQNKPHGPGQKLFLCQLCSFSGGFNRCSHLDL